MLSPRPRGPPKDYLLGENYASAEIQAACERHQVNCLSNRFQEFRGGKAISCWGRSLVQPTKKETGQTCFNITRI